MSEEIVTSPATEEQEEIKIKRPSHRKPRPVHDTLFKIRQVLNLLFMLLGVIGAVMYSGYFGDGKIIQMGGVVVIIAISMKMAECVLRYRKTEETT